jgi:hypothetical protein
MFSRLSLEGLSRLSYFPGRGVLPIQPLREVMIFIAKTDNVLERTLKAIRVIHELICTLRTMKYHSLSEQSRNLIV